MIIDNYSGLKPKTGKEIRRYQMELERYIMRRILWIIPFIVLILSLPAKAFGLPDWD